MSFEIICIYLFVFSIFTKILSKIYKENLTNKNILMVSIIGSVGVIVINNLEELIDLPEVISLMLHFLSLTFIYNKVCEIERIKSLKMAMTFLIFVAILATIVAMIISLGFIFDSLPELNQMLQDLKYKELGF